MAANFADLNLVISSFQDWLKHIVTIQTAVVAGIGISLNHSQGEGGKKFAAISISCFLFSYTLSAILFQSVIWNLQNKIELISLNIYDITVFFDWLNFGILCTLQNIAFLFGIGFAGIHVLHLSPVVFGRSNIDV